MEVSHRCFVCGFDLGGFPPWGADGTTPSHSICPCCGTEFGYEDCTRFAVEMAHARWVERGCPWASTTEPPPAGWNAAAQLARRPQFLDLDDAGRPVDDPRHERVARRFALTEHPHSDTDDVITRTSED